MKWFIARGILGLLLAGLVIWLGIKTAAQHPEPIFIALFGIGAALLGPTAVSLIAGAFPSERNKALDRLSKAGDIERRVEAADTMEQKVKALENERRQLTDIIRFEARRQMILDRQVALKFEVELLAQETEQVLAELKAIENESRHLGEEIDNSSVKKDIMAVRDRLQRERTRVGHRSINFLDDLLGSTPIMPPLGPILRPIVRFSGERTLTGIENFRTERLARRAARASTEKDPKEDDDAPAANDNDQKPSSQP